VAVARSPRIYSRWAGGPLCQATDRYGQAAAKALVHGAGDTSHEGYPGTTYPQRDVAGLLDYSDPYEDADYDRDDWATLP
jgi:hypothetical protein